ncbi:MAG: DUF502 domain-containing protein [Candidatus Omnitrophica bacterium]|nr:DUF502 domain-containing protein [Candidatus Omnitrophota bacterium]
MPENDGKRIINMLRRWFLTGLAVLIPIVITIYVIVGLFQFTDGILGKYINRYVYLYFGYTVPGLGIIFSLVIIFLVGAFASFLRFRIFKNLETVLLKIPLVGKIYRPSKRIVNFLFLQEKPSFKKVVLVEYPRRGAYCIGFVTNESPEKINQKISKKMLNIFIPSSPSPITGFTLIVPEEEVIFLDITVEEATRIIVSGGMLDPEDAPSSKLT